MYHTMLQLMPVQLVSGCDMILYAPFIYEWEDIRILKQELIVNINHKINIRCVGNYYFTIYYLFWQDILSILVLEGKN